MQIFPQTLILATLFCLSPLVYGYMQGQVMFSYVIFPHDFSLSALLLSFCLYVLTLFFIPRQIKDFRSFVVSLYFGFLVFPGLTLLCFDIHLLPYVVLLLICFFVLELSSSIVVSSSSLRFIKVGIRKLHFLLIILSLFVLCYVLSRDYSYSLSSFLSKGLSELYSARAAVYEQGSWDYHFLHPIVTKAFLSFSFLYSVVKRRYFMAFICILIFFLFAVATSHKSIIFIPLFSLSCYFFVEYSRRARLNAVIIGVVAIPLFFGLIYVYLCLNGFTLASPVYIFSDQIYRRLFMLPAALSGMYYDFFVTLNNPIDFFADSKISLGLISNPYSQISVPHLLSEHIGYTIEGHANAGLIGSGIQHLHVLGPIFYSFFVGVVCSCISRLQISRSNLSFVCAYFSSFFLWIFTSTDLPAVFLTHGLLGALLIVNIVLTGDSITHNSPRL